MEFITRIAQNCTDLGIREPGERRRMYPKESRHVVKRNIDKAGIGQGHEGGGDRQGLEAQDLFGW